MVRKDHSEEKDHSGKVEFEFGPEQEEAGADSGARMFQTESLVCSVDRQTSV